MIPGTCSSQLTRLDFGYRVDYFWHKWYEIGQPIRYCSDKNDSEWLICELLLMTKISVHGDENVELTSGDEVVRRFSPAPSLTQDGIDLVWTEMFAKTERNILVK